MDVVKNQRNKPHKNSFISKFFFTIFTSLFMIGACTVIIDSIKKSKDKERIITDEKIKAKEKELDIERKILTSGDNKDLFIPKKFHELALKSAVIVAIANSCNEIHSIKKAYDAKNRSYEFGKTLEDSVVHVYCEGKDKTPPIQNSYYQYLSDTQNNKYSNLSKLDPRESFNTCIEAVKSKVIYKNTFDYSSVRERLNNAYYHVSFNFTAKNAFNLEIESQAKCTIATLSPSTPSVSVM